MKDSKTVVHISTVHNPEDPRIFHKECQTLKKAGFDVRFIVSTTEETKPNSDVKIIPLKKYKNKLSRMLFSTIEAYRKARKQKADYYHIHDPELLPVAWLLKTKRNVVIYDIHEDYETSIMQKEYLPKFLRKFIANAYKMVEQAFSKNLELCLAEKYYKEKYPRGTCILNYPILNKTMMNRERKSTTIDSPLLYTGNLSVERGALIHATLPRIDERLFVYFYGRCPQKLATKMYEIAGNKKEQLKLKGIDQYVPKKEIDDAYMSQSWLAGIALFPPTEHYMRKELTKFFEYMSAGIPIVCSNFPVWKDFVEKYSCGLVVDPYDENQIKKVIEYLRENPNEVKKMGNNGKKAVQSELNWEKEGEKLVVWYNEIWERKYKFGE
ncbi:glycosyl transferase [Anaerobacillus alkalilacustris]|uniref:Glycosyl transferase n=1 Tax=Anaerobacillus alkalilacustris TaxID=393763 RepID=A0A1S2LH52_9BACI|nr:glycosyltransferase [Anaerobacillus alkalilacustris]OIJ11706.1 glycosyl transferase [Anaerobacillus alkalilacustris]